MELSAEAEQPDEVQFSVKHFQRPQQGCAVRDKKPQQRITLDTQRCPSTPGQDFTNPSEEKKGLLCHHHKKIKAIDLFSVLFLIELIFSSEKAASPNIVLG